MTFDWRKALTRSILFDSALAAYEKSDKKEEIMSAALRVGALALLNPDATKKVKNLAGNLLEKGMQSNHSEVKTKTPAERLKELRALCDARIITEQEYEAQRVNIIAQL